MNQETLVKAKEIEFRISEAKNFLGQLDHFVTVHNRNQREAQISLRISDPLDNYSWAHVPDYVDVQSLVIVLKAVVGAELSKLEREFSEL